MAGDETGARAVLEEAVRVVDARSDVPPDVAADCMVGLARVIEREVDRPDHVEEAAALYQRALAMRADAAVRARLAVVGTLAPEAGPFASVGAALAHIQELRCAGDAACRVWATQESSSWQAAAIREARIVVASTAADGARAYLIVLTDAGVFVMPPVATALSRDGMTGGVGGTVEHRSVLPDSRRQLVVRFAAFRDFAERWEAARPTVQRTIVCDVVDGAPRCTQPFDEAALGGRSGRRRLELSGPGRVTIRRDGAPAAADETRAFDDLRCAPWLFADGACPAP